MITQAVADTLNLKIYIGESNENFMEITLVNQQMLDPCEMAFGIPRNS